MFRSNTLYWRSKVRLQLQNTHQLSTIVWQETQRRVQQHSQRRTKSHSNFEDGSKATGHLLVGADGSKSMIRKYLLGPEIAALQPLPIMGLRATYTIPPEDAKKLVAELQGQVTGITYHPAGCVAFFPSTSLSCIPLLISSRWTCLQDPSP